MRSSHDTANPGSSRSLTSEAPSAIHWLEELGVEFTRANGGYRPGALRRRDAATAPAGGRPDRACDHEGAARAFEAAPAPSSRTTALVAPARERLATPPRRRKGATSTPRAIVLAAAGGASREAESARRALDEPPECDRRGHADRARRRRRGARPRRAPVPPERRRLAGDDAGLLDSRDHARVRRGPPERRRRGVHGLARPARRGVAGDLRRGGEGEGDPHDRRRPPGGLARHDEDQPRGRRDLAAVHAPALPRLRHRPARRADPTPTPSSTTRTAGS